MTVNKAPLVAGEYLTEAEFSDRFRVPVRTAQRWRTTGDGPAFVRCGPRRVLYRLTDCENWAAARTFRHRAAELAARELKLASDKASPAK